MIAWIFPLIVIGGIIGAIHLKICLSGNNLNATKLFFCIVFNGVFAVPYLDIIKADYFVFLGKRPDILQEFPFIGAVALVGVCVHALALPNKSKLRWRFSES
ncbi:hypothetical protein QN400_00755 [Pseudomonas sp. RTC3]|uniref:hypothetical protein n=1 Tax=Pseudomonas sp. 5C2 TaxID=3048588 RepID=UPI002AB4C30B|nr:hypothetical protein [Pseudomonas sp. 5C2]MDY7563589.1 hypothetical protein [Pseudomonas sp. 5C2]MEB0060565.1 hypothetical protein [Pseudomonas sp. RTC3]MEB0243584.1 hypothetical protein [Pseudomonas sp. 5C2]